MTPPSAGGWPSTTPPSSNVLLPTASGARLKQKGSASRYFRPPPSVRSLRHQRYGPCAPSTGMAKSTNGPTTQGCGTTSTVPLRSKKRWASTSWSTASRNARTWSSTSAKCSTAVLVTTNGWVQSYGSRCVKPPIIFGDVSRPRPMTVDWAVYAQSRTERPMKGMLTGPITILQWSFVRNDQPHEVTARQIALAIRDEVADLEAAGIKVIQIDEPALREGLPLHAASARTIWHGRWRRSSWRPRGYATRPRSTRTCVTRNSMTSSSRSPPSTPT